MTPFVTKDHPDLPDSYGVIVTLISGKKTSYDVASHMLVERSFIKEVVDENGKIIDQVTTSHSSPYFEFHTKDDRTIVIPMSAIGDLEFDIRWSKVVEIRNAMKKLKGE